MSDKPEQEPTVGFVRCELNRERNPLSGLEEASVMEIRAFYIGFRYANRTKQ